MEFEVDLPLFGRTIPVKAEVPDARMRLSDLVPLAWSICDRIVSAAQASAESQGRTVSCRKGCSGCCGAYLPGMAEPEAFRLIEDIQRLPNRARERILRGFLEFGEMAEKSGVYEEVKEKCGGIVTTGHGARILRDWWARVRRDCPILENNACSMHSHRPTVCREFLAVSDPALCARCQADKVYIPVNMYNVLGRLGGELLGDGSRATIIIFPTLLKWYAARKSRGRRTWRAPAMVERFLAILLETAERSSSAEGPEQTGCAANAHAATSRQAPRQLQAP